MAVKKITYINSEVIRRVNEKMKLSKVFPTLTPTGGHQPMDLLYPLNIKAKLFQKK